MFWFSNWTITLFFILSPRTSTNYCELLLSFSKMNEGLTTFFFLRCNSVLCHDKTGLIKRWPVKQSAPRIALLIFTSLLSCFRQMTKSMKCHSLVRECIHVVLYLLACLKSVLVSVRSFSTLGLWSPWSLGFIFPMNDRIVDFKLHLKWGSTKWLSFINPNFSKRSAPLWVDKRGDNVSYSTRELTFAFRWNCVGHFSFKIFSSAYENTNIMLHVLRLLDLLKTYTQKKSNLFGKAK